MASFNTNIPGRMAIVALLAVQLSACANWSERASDSVSEASTLVPVAWHDTPSDPSRESTLRQWWGEFNDPLLSQLIDRALLANHDIAAAEGRLRSARAAVKGAHGARLPALNASGNASYREAVNGPDLDLEGYDLGIDATWEVDLFGKLRHSERAADADLAGARASLWDVQRVIAGDIALAYVNLRDAQARLSIARQNLKTQQDNLEIAQWRYQAGLGNELDAMQARTGVAQTRATIAPLQNTINSAIYQIDVLLGQAPGSSADLLAPVSPLPTTPGLVGVGFPAELLQRRPDVQLAQRNLEAAVLRIGVAEADLYPALRLGGFINTTAETSNDLFDVSVAGVLGGVTAPIFQGGQIRARIEQQKGSADVALANYRSTILRALQDVEAALSAVAAAQDREANLREAEDAALASLKLAEIRYQNGAIDFQTLLDVQRSLLQVQDGRASASAAYSSAAIQLYKALGGGWQDAGTT